MKQWDFQVDTLTDADLTALQEQVGREIRVRNENKRSRKWKAVVDAIKEYVNAYGAITVEGYECDVDIDLENNFTNCGFIEKR